MLQLIFVLVFITIMLFFQPIMKYFLSHQKAILRIKRYTGMDMTKEGKRRVHQKEYRTGLGFIAKGFKKARFLDKYKKNIQYQLNRGHLLLKSEEYITLCFVATLGTAFLFFLCTRSVMITILAGILGRMMPSMIMKGRIKKRIKHLNEQLGDAIVLISNSLKAGYSFFQAMDIVVKEMKGPIAEEFSLMQKEINFGLPTEKALENIVVRVGSDDLELMITAVLIQRQIGGNLAEVLDNISSTIRDRVKIEGEIKTITAQGRMSGLIISLLPLALGILIYIINPEHMSVLFKHPLGIFILAFSMLMELVGIYFIHKVVKIQV